MQELESLTHRGQVRRLRRLAESALAEYPLDGPVLRFIAHEENTTFRVVAADEPQPPPYQTGHFLLRVHRPRRHGRGVDSTLAVESELLWLAALRRDTDLSVPEPVPTIDGSLVAVVESPGVPEPRVCSLLRWQKGRTASRPAQLHSLGGAMAVLHDHTEAWPIPDPFLRIRWDADAFFGDSMTFGGITPAEAMMLVPAEQRGAFETVAGHAAATMRDLGHGPDVFGLIHADLHLGNVVFRGGEPRLIDFDDCGFGHRIYDIAVALWELRWKADWPQWYQAFCDGYGAHRPLPPDLSELLDTFIAARDVAFGLWYVGMSRVNPMFRADMSEELTQISEGFAKLDLPISL